MITAEQQTRWQERQLAALTPPHRGPDSGDLLERVRQRARASLPEQPVLNRKQEAWRYTSVDKLLAQTYAAPRHREELGEADIAGYDLPELDGYRLVFHNGQCLPKLARLDGLPQGAIAGSLRACLSTDGDLISRHLGQQAGLEGNLFTALNGSLIDNGLLLHIGAGVELDRPIQIVHISEGLGQAVVSQPRHLIVLEAGAKATLVEHFVGQDADGYFHNNLAEIVLGEHAALEHYRLQEEGDASYHLSSLYLQLQAASLYRGTALSFGGAWARTDYKVAFAGEAASCDLSGLYTVGDEQLNDIHLDVRHSLPRCTSRERFKGIAHGEGHAVFDGRVLVERDAQRSDARLKNDNLMLSRKAMIDTKPQLEIYADDVVCSHGTTVGQIEPDQLFYLRSRGIGPATALRMLCQGFAGEIVEEMDLEPLRGHAYARLSSILDNASPTE